MPNKVPMCLRRTGYGKVVEKFLRQLPYPIRANSERKRAAHIRIEIDLPNGPPFVTFMSSSTKVGANRTAKNWMAQIRRELRARGLSDPTR